jgi:demethylmenaquinone methyltransferase/2-methoxy-6-polyprenyl-1,4-benzoquinol methylase
MYSLNFINKIYSFWGKAPFVYNTLNIITFLGKEKFLRQNTVAEVGFKKGDTALDIACGFGVNFPYLRRAVGKEGKIIGFDYTQGMLDAARRLYIKKAGWKNIELIQGDAAELDLPEESIDGIISTLGISAIPRHFQAFKLAKRALKKGKKMVVLDAKLFKGGLKVFNPFLKLSYIISASWDYKKDIIGDFSKLFSNIHIDEYNKGTLYILKGTKS